MIRRLSSALAVLALALLPTLAGADMLDYIPPPGTYTGGAITTPILAPAADNCAAVPYSATGSTTTGMCWSATDAVKIKLSPSTYVSTASDVYVVVNQQLLVGGGSYSHWLGTNKTTMPSGSYFGWNSDAGSAASGTDDLKLFRDAAGVLALRNSTNAQTFNWYYSYTDGSNFQRGALKTSATGIEIAAETAGIGADDINMEIKPAGAGHTYLYGGGFSRLDVAPGGVTVEGGASLYVGLLALTNATMSAEDRYSIRTATSSYTWTNAQVVALGAALEGDITVATLPAKTQVLDAAVVITGTAAGTTTLTVSCGDAIAGTPFTNYILPADAQAAVNTYYGDANAERGASLDGDPPVYLPSYTATTLVTCHFISTVANLDQVTGSTGRVILTTRLLP